MRLEHLLSGELEWRAESEKLKAQSFGTTLVRSAIDLIYSFVIEDGYRLQATSRKSLEPDP